MKQVIQAVYEHGVLRPAAPLTGLVEGQQVQVTVHPVVADAESIKHREAEFLQFMDSMGMLERFPPPSEPPPPDFQPLIIQGEPLSETIIRERR